MRRSNATLFSIAPFTLIVLTANIALYAVSAIRSQNLMHMDTGVLAALGASQRERLWEGEWLRLVAPIFLHGGFIHIGLNMYYLWRAGPDAEVYFGTSNYGTIYLLSGITGVCLSQIFGGHLSIGASGSLCGIMGAHLAVLVLNCPVPSKAWRNSAVRAEALSLLFLIFIGVIGFMNMDNWGHLGGMLCGIALGTSFELWRRRKVMGQLGVFAALACVGLLICAARWTIFNPVYHIFEAAYSREEMRDAQAEKMHASEAQKWGAYWRPLHFLGVVNDTEAVAILKAYDAKHWNLDTARNPRMTMLYLCALFKSGYYPNDDLTNSPDSE